MIAEDTGFYVTGGTLQRDTPSYVERQADTALYAALRQGEFCYVLTSRQMGKSSLMVRTAGRLREGGIAVANFELTALGRNLTAEQWYDGLLGTIGQELELEEAVEQFWLEHERLSPLQRWLRALREVVLARRPGRVVICLDEIDAVRSLPFSTDEFFAAIRECYNRRSEDPALNRLTFCLLGVASPSDLIQDTRTTPFNIGRRIELTDFTEAEAAPLAAGLGVQAFRRSGVQEERTSEPERLNARTPEHFLRRILYWTGGHPYLTQRLCQAVAHDPNPKSKIQNPKSTVDRLCAELFLSSGAREQDDNLLFVRERLLKSEADPASLLTLYRQVRSGGRVRDDETNPLVTTLRLSGIVRLGQPHTVRSSGHPVIRSSSPLRVRNRIYARVFDGAWVAANMPDAEVRRQRAAFRKGLLRSAAIAGAVVAVIGELALSAVREKDRVGRLLYVADMNVAQQALNEGNPERAQELLDEHRPGKPFRGASLAPAEAEMRGFEWRYLWQLCQEGALCTLPGHRGTIWDVAYSADGKMLAAANADGTVTLWDVARRGILREFPAHEFTTGSVRTSCVAFSPDSKILAVGTEAGSGAAVTLWNPASRREVATLPGPGGHLWFSPDGELLAAVDWQGRTSPDVFTLKLWDLTTRQVVATFQERGLLWAAFAPDGKTLALARGGSSVELWNVAAKRSMALLRTPKDWAWWVAFSPDGKTLATYTLDQAVKLWDPTTWRVVATLQAPRSTADRRPGGPMVFSPDGKKLATAIGATREVALWDLVRRRKTGTLRGHKAGILSLAFSPDSGALASGGADGTVKVHSAASEAEGTPLGQPVAELFSLAFSSDGKALATAGADGMVRLWDALSQRPVASLQGHRGPVRSVAFSPDGKLLASAGSDRIVRLWRVASPRPLAALRGHKDQVWCVAFSPNGHLLASGGEDGIVQLWDAATQRSIGTLRTGAGIVIALAFSPDGKTLALGTNEYSVKLWDLAAREEVASLLAHSSSVTAVAFSPDGRTLASGSADHAVELWDVAGYARNGGGQPLLPPLKGCKARVKAVAFSPDGRTLASGSADGTVRLWNVATGREVARLTGQQGPVSCVAFSPDGNALAACGKEGRVRLWRAAPFADTDAGELAGSSSLSSSPLGPGAG